MLARLLRWGPVLLSAVRGVSVLRVLGLAAVLLAATIGFEELRLAWGRQATAEAQAQAAKLKTALSDQNAAVDRLAAAGQRANLDANLAALRALRDGDSRRAALAGSGHGPAALNNWLSETFPP